MIAKTAEKEDKDKIKIDGGVTHRPKKQDNKSKRKTSASSKLSAPLSAIFNEDTHKLIVDPDAKVEDTAEFDLNISFSGGYVPNTDLSRVDKGQGNPQFEGFDAN